MPEATARAIPLDYGDASAEYRAVRQRVGVIDRGDRGLIEATGRDRASFLHALLSNEIKALTPGQGCAATLLDDRERQLREVVDQRLRVQIADGADPDL